MEAVAVTDHGMTSALLDHYMACEEQGVKPILGCEMYACQNMNEKDPDDKYTHLVVLAKDAIGYANLQRLVTLGSTNGFYTKPRVDWETIAGHRKGLIVLTACLGGEIPQMILKDVPLDLIARKIKGYMAIVPDFYLEVQPYDHPDQRKVNQAILQLSEMTGAKIVATSDIHFMRKEDFTLHGVFIQINKHHDNDVYRDAWFKTEDEMLEGLADQIGFDAAMEAIAETHKIAAMCDVKLELGKSYLPKFPIPAQFKDENTYLQHLINEGWKKRRLHLLLPAIRKRYIDRVMEEWNIIAPKGFAGYFLIVRDIMVNLCEANGIYRGDGRGSADNCLIAYILSITNTDPMLYDLNFSRFLTIERTDLPDIDMDIPSSYKQYVVNLIKEKYGKESVAQVCNFGGLQGKSLVEAVGKLLGLDYKEIQSIKRHIPDTSKLSDALKTNDTLQTIKATRPELFSVCERLEGLPRSIGTHAGGVVICPSDRDMSEFVALTISNSDEIITQFEMNNIQSIGLVKMDVLATATLDVIADTLQLIGKGWDYLDVATLDFTDKKTWELLQQSETDGVFQLESSGMKDACKRVQPANMEDLIAILALYRPDTMSELEHYIKRKSGAEPITYLHPDMEPILNATFGCMVYQEQVMGIVKKFAGFTDGEADKFRKGIGKKKKELVQEQAEKFRTRCIEEGYPEEIANEIADDLAKKGGYMFNKGHSAGYAITSFKTAYLKANHPTEFMCALLSNQRKSSGSTDYAKMGSYIAKSREMGIKVKCPDINLSDDWFSVVNGEILFGLTMMRGVGEGAVKIIKQLRPFKDFEDFLTKTDNQGSINKAVIISLIKGGAFDYAGKSRRDLLTYFGSLGWTDLKTINKNHINKMLGEGVIHPEERTNKALCLKRWNKWAAALSLKEFMDKEMAGDEDQWEYDSLSYRLTNNPFEGVPFPAWESFEDGSDSAIIIGMVLDSKKTKVKNGKSRGKEMAFVKFETPEGVREVTFFSDEWEKYQEALKPGAMFAVRGQKQGDSMVGKTLMTLAKWKELKTKCSTSD